jgi:branched-chain amino acid transport system ATP-binding protein
MVAARNKGAAVRNMERIFGFFPQLKERASHPGSKLSGGEQQMLSVARALMGNPDLFLMDEPTEGLAPLLVENLKNVIQGFKQEALSVLLVEQDLGLALEIADYIYVMGQGKIVYEASPKEFRENEDVKHRYLGV